MEQTKVKYADTLKSADTEETLDLWLYRPIGYAWALLFRRLGIRPNPVTVASIFIGIAAGILFAYSDLCYNVAGMILLVIANSLDSADGQLARMTNDKTRIGRILDGMAGNLWFITIYIALCIRLQNEGFAFWIWGLGALAGGSHIQQASMADYYRNIHLYFLKGKENSEVDYVEQLIPEFKKLSWSKNFVPKIMMTFYINYTSQQERLTPRLQQFLKHVRERFGDALPQWLRDEFRAKNISLMKYTNMLTFNTRVIALFVSLFLRMPWLYFCFELTVLNLMLIYMIVKQGRISEYFYKKLKDAPEKQ
ncbi:MAG: CDP-alcohol phosphatidyltransferase family protein [Bacteroidales bacterium]|nr:CDP-alcohol phosphatidyltransferase family protein [Bacteroidales bacterium]